MGSISRLRQIWSWLPAFRMVGETEHVRGAADALHVSASALSRSIALLEDDLGVLLFTRSGRHLALTEEGKMLLNALRRAMDDIREAVLEVEGGVLRGQVRISSPGTVMRILLLPALARLRSDYRDLHPKLSTFPDDELIDRLQKNTLDVAFTTHRLPEESLTQTLLGRYTCGIYSGVEHRLAAAKSPTVEEVCDCLFVAPPADLRGAPREGWPRDLERNVAVEVSDLQAGIEFCSTGDFLAVLPDLLVTSDVTAGRLRRLPLDLIDPVQIFAAHCGSSRARVTIEAAAKTAAELGLTPHC